MAIVDDLTSSISTILGTTWNSRDGQVVPKTEEVTLVNGAVKLDATMLYADLANSTQLVRNFNRSMAAKIVRAYLSTMTRLIRNAGGHVRSFDGDRVMGVFIGDSKNTNAVDCALKMNLMMSLVIKPKAEEKFPSLKESGFILRHGVGVSSSDVLVVRGGIRDNNDLVFIGSAPNIAAKLSDLRDGNYSIHISWNIYKHMNDSVKFGGDPKQNMWTATSAVLAGDSWDLYKSSWRRKP